MDTSDLEPKSIEEEGDENANPAEFRLLLKGEADLEGKLRDFKAACDAHEKHIGRKRKRRYYHMGLVAKLVNETTPQELHHMLENGVYTFHIDAVCNKPDDLTSIFECMNLAIAAYSREQQLRIVTGLAVEINGECCRIGRLRNGCTVMLARGAVMTLTTNEKYKYCGFKEISYVINLKSYIKGIKLGDIIYIGREIRCRVVKCLPDNIAVHIIDAGLLISYDYIELPEQCNLINPELLPDLYMQDLKLALHLKANYIILPKIRCKAFLRALRRDLIDDFNFKLIGMIDFEYVRKNMIDLLGLIKLLDYLWIPDMFNLNSCIYNYVMDDVLPISFCQKKPVMGTVPLERCSDFKRFESHEFLYKIDTIHIQKSPWCNKYPLIVKKLMPIRDFRIGVVQNKMVLKNILTSYQTIVNFIIRTISSIECQAIFLYTKCETASVALARTEIYCPVYMMIPIEEYDDEEALRCKHNLARILHLRRNIFPIVFTKEINVCKYDTIEFGIDYMRRKGCIDVGDFIITLEVGKEDVDNITVGIGEDVVILRAFYVPPLKMCEKFKYGMIKP